MKKQQGNPLTLGVIKLGYGYNFAVRSLSCNIKLELYEISKMKPGKEKNPDIVVELDKSYKTGDVFAVMITEVDLSNYLYRYMDGGVAFVDDYAKTLYGCEKFGVNEADASYFSRVENEEFDWGDDVSPNLSFSDSIIYKLHVRGFTKHRSSQVGIEHRGTFAGIMDKLEYLRELGITTLELMPAYEFDETQRFSENPREKYALTTMMAPRYFLNYWGYSKGHHFAPKAAFTSIASSGKYCDYTVEFKELVKMLHSNGMEVIMEMYFTHDESYLIQDCLRYWVMEYHIDGFHLYCDECRLYNEFSDPVLGNVKILTMHWDGEDSYNKTKRMANYNTGFDEVAKRILKGDENQLSHFVYLLKENPYKAANINYVTNHNGFTLMDLVSYDRKHNEENGEDNRDGENFNYSWNCGFEGPTNKKRINELRLAQVKNAFMMLLTAQGTPLILAGDEFGNSQGGNNNPYCQDNETTWLEWKKTKMANEILEFVKEAIDFRKNHKILHLDVPLSSSDSLSCGYPDVSCHGDMAWFSRMESFERHVGLMYCGRYDKNDPKDELIYVAYNLHWESHRLALPVLESGGEWKNVITTVKDKKCVIDGKGVVVPPRSIAVFVGSIKKKQVVKKTSKVSKTTKSKKVSKSSK